MFTVYQDNVRCSDHAKKGDYQNPYWHKDSFETKREAEVYAYCWAYPFDLEESMKIAPEMEIGKEYDYSMYEFPVMMKIENTLD